MYGGQGAWNGGANLIGMGMGLDVPHGLGGMTGAYIGQANSLTGRGIGRGGVTGAARSLAFVEGKLFLGGLDSTTSKESLTLYCSQWGELSDAVVMEGRGFGFVTFEEPKNALTFLEHRHHLIDGKSVEAKAAVPKGAGGSSNLTKKLFVGGTGDVTDEEFKTYFELFGEIEDAAIVRRSDGASRGFGFVTFADEMSVEKCLVMQHELSGKHVDLRRAIPREQMATQGAFGLGLGFGGMRSGYGVIPGFGSGMGMHDMATIGGPYLNSYSMASLGVYQQDYGIRGNMIAQKAANRFSPY